MLKPTRILVPTDFTSYSEKALRQALVIAAEYGAEVHVLHVVHERIHGVLFDDYADISVTEGAIKNLEKGLAVKAKVRIQKQIRKFPEAKSIEVHELVTSGIPYEEIVGQQKKLGADLVVISSLGHSAIGRYLIGSVARNVLKGASCPVLLTKDVFMSKPGRILVPTDFSTYSDHALKQGLDIARQYGSKLFLLHVLPDMWQYAVEYAVAQETIRAAEIQSEESGLARMNAQLGRFGQPKGVDVTAVLSKGLVYETILEEVRQREIDLVVIASLGRSGIAKYLIGSVARNVLKGAECPVLITR